MSRKGKTLENKKLARHQARTRKRGLQAQLPPLRSHLAKAASENEGTQDPGKSKTHLAHRVTYT